MFLAVQSLTPCFLPDYTKFPSFFRLLNRKFNKDSKNVLKSVIVSLQVGFTHDFLPDCLYKLCFWLSFEYPSFKTIFTKLLTADLKNNFYILHRLEMSFQALLLLNRHVDTSVLKNRVFLKNLDYLYKVCTLSLVLKMSFQASSLLNSSAY